LSVVEPMDPLLALSLDNAESFGGFLRG
jgi:hypothetical protein